MWLLDTVTICEPTKPGASEAVTRWLSDQAPEGLHTSVLCIGEIRRGVEKLPPGSKRTVLRQWLEAELPAWFGPRILPIDLGIAQLWGELTATAGRSVPTVDAMIAATAIHHRLTVVTRNVRDYEALDIDVFNPWEV